MRHLIGIGVLVAVGALGAAAQQRGQQGMYGGVSTGRMVGSVGDPGFAGRLGATISGLPQTVPYSPPGYRGRPVTYPGYNGPGFNGMHRGNQRVNTVVVPYGVPVVYGGGFGYGYADQTMAPPPVVQEQVQPAPAVIINQYYTPDVVRPQMKEYTDLPPTVRQQEAPQAKTDPQPATVVESDGTKATITLLAFKDSSVISVIAYWLQGDTIHYITSGYKKHTAPANTLNKSLSEKLNAERKVEFKLE